MSGWAQALAAAVDLVPVVSAGVTGGLSAWRDRKKSPAERLAEGPRPVDAALVAMVKERRRQRDGAAVDGAGV